MQDTAPLCGGMEFLPPAQACRFHEVHNFRDLVKNLEVMGLEGSLLLGREDVPVGFNIKNQQEAAQSILEQLLQNIQHKGSPKRHLANLIALESGLGGGKTHTVATLKEHLCEAVDEALSKAGSTVPAGYATHKQLHAAFHDEGHGRVACIRMEFDGDDGPSDRDVKANASVFMGVRLFARGFWGVSTTRLRSVLPPGLEHLLTIKAVLPLVCERLRSLHGLARFTPQAVADPKQWLVLLLTLDEMHRIQTFLESMGRARHTATDFCRDISRTVADLVYIEHSSPCPVGFSTQMSPSAACGVNLQAVVLGTCLGAFANHVPTQLVWKQIALQPLDFEQSKQLVMLSLLSEPAWIQLLPTEAERVAFSLRLFGTVEMQAAIEMGGGVPGILKAGAQALADAAVLVKVEWIHKNNAWEASTISDLATAWTGKWVESLKERFQYSNLIDSVGILAAKEVLLLVLSGNAVQQSRKLSGCTLSDVLESGAFYMSDYRNGYYSVTLPAFLLHLFYDALSMRPGQSVFCEAEREAILQLIKPQVRSHRGTSGKPFEVMVAAQVLVTAACWRALGKESVTIGCLFRAAHKGIRGGYLSPELQYTNVKLHDSMRLLTSRSNGAQWGEKGSSAAHRAPGLNPWLKVKRPPRAASASLLDPGYVVLVDKWSDSAVRPVADVGVRMAYITKPPARPILLLLNLKLREGAHEHCGTFTTVRSSFQSFLEPASEDAKLPVQPLVGLVTPGKVDKDAFLAATEAAAALGEPLLIISEDACIDFMPVLRHRPILRGICTAAPISTP